MKPAHRDGTTTLDGPRFRRGRLRLALRLALLIAPVSFALAAPAPEKRPTRSWGDQGDGTYRNPILPGDFQNTDVIRVGGVYYYISATKELSPGMMIMSSPDLVNWQVIGHAVPQLTEIDPRYGSAEMRGAGRGIWAGAIRYHDNKFWVYFTDPDEGLFMTTAPRASGPWRPLTRLMKSAGWDDPCPFWDDDGQAYLVATHFADQYKIHLFRMSADGTQLQPDSDRVIHQGHGSEANKLYKIGGYYYHFYSEVTAEGRMPFMARSRRIVGPYEERRQLIHRADGEPNQGGLVETEAGAWYFVTHHGTSKWDGREASLLPVTWVDGWPVWGTPGADGVGNMVWSARKPAAGSAPELPQGGDEFGGPALSPQWEWYFQPRADKWSLQERPGFLRLYACRPLQPGVLAQTPDILTQRPLRAERNTATAKLDVTHLADGEIAGLALFGKTSGVIGVRRTGARRGFYVDEAGGSTPGPLLGEPAANVWLRATWNAAGHAQFLYSTDGLTFTPLGETYVLTNFSNYLGAKIGLFTANDRQESGYVDIDWFHYDLN